VMVTLRKDKTKPIRTGMSRMRDEFVDWAGERACTS
jgi:hypothetical protein